MNCLGVALGKDLDRLVPLRPLRHYDIGGGGYVCPEVCIPAETFTKTTWPLVGPYSSSSTAYSPWIRLYNPNASPANISD
jgi:hypothetical protein